MVGEECNRLLTDPAHVFFSGGASRVAGQRAMLQLGREQLEAAGSSRQALPDGQPLVRPVRPLVVSPYVHGVAMGPLLGGEGAGVPLTVRQRVARRRQRVSVAPLNAAVSGVQAVWRFGLLRGLQTD